MHLVYVNDSQPGYYRKKVGQGFVFEDAKGTKLTDEETLLRIKSLVIPPAWTNVWVCAKANGHLQATGIDKAGRKQYKYHPKWSQKRNEHKHNRMSEFADALPLIRKKVESDLRKEEFTKDKVVALAISVMDKTHIRVGNAVYTKLYGSFGLTSLRNRHVKIMGNKMVIAFKGKKGVFQEIKLTHGRLARLVQKLKDIPGQELFQYYDADGTKKSIDSDAINEYLYQITGKDFTAKDFRTWWGTVTAMGEFIALSTAQEHVQIKQATVAVLDIVAKHLGNTRAVCKKYYVHPTLLAYYEEGKLEKYITRSQQKEEIAGDDLLNADERIIRDFILNECKQAA